MRDAELLQRAEDALRLAKAAGADMADALAIAGTEISAGIRNGEPETIERAESVGIGLRVFVGQGSASLSSSELSNESLKRMAEQAVAIARVAPPDPYAGLASPELLAKNIAALDLADDAEPTMEELQRLARDTEAAGRTVSGITNSEGADAGSSRHAIALATSTGFRGSYAATRHSLSLSLIAGKGESMQRDYDYSMTTHRAHLANAEAIGQSAAHRTLERMHPRKLASQTATIYFEPRVGRALLGAFAGAISGSAIARGTSFLKDALGKAVFADAVTVTDDPLRPRGLASHPFDAEGVRVQKRALIENGILTTWLLDTRSANQLGLAPTGHASRGLSGPPHPSASNLYIEPGASTPEELFAEFGDGFYVTETIGHGTNLITGDYSLGASGFWIEGGKRAFPVSEVTIAGNLRDMFRNVAPANDLEFRYGTNVPTLAIPHMTIAGN